MIRRRLITLFVLQIAIVLLASGVYLRYHLQTVLENELGKKLEAITAAIAAQMDVSLISMLAPGDEKTRTFRNLQQRLIEIKSATRMQRIVAFTPEGRIWLDTQAASVIGSRYLRQDFDKIEIEAVLQGRTASSILFAGYDGKLYKSGYAPLRLKDQTVGIIAVEGSAESLQTIRAIQANLLQIGFVSLVLSFVLAVLASHQLTAPLLKLQACARKIGHGIMDQSIIARGKDEMAFLAQTMEEMRKAILQRDEQQRAMLAGIAHEIRNPVGGIELFAGLLRDELADPQLRAKAEKILKESKNLKTLIQSFLDYAKPVAPKREASSVEDCWREAMDLVTHQAHSNGIQIAFSGHATAFVDPQHLKQVFLNLALNAIQAMPNGGSLHALAVNRENQILIDVSDTGAGIAKEMQEHIFEPFYSSKENGMGLGLAVVKNLLESNGGSIDLEESGPHGTRFRLRLPPIAET